MENNTVLSGELNLTNELELSGNIIAQTVVAEVQWGKIKGQIENQEDLIDYIADTVEEHNTSNTAHQDIRQDVSRETQARQEADSQLSQAISQEVSRATQVEATKVDKVAGKQLSTEDYTTAEKEKLASIDPSSMGKVDDVYQNGVSVLGVDKIARVTVPTKTSDLTNDSNFVSDADYVHTDNNFTTAEKTKLDELDPEEMGKIDDVKVNGTSVVVNKVANITVPTKTSDLTNDSGFVQNAFIVINPSMIIQQDPLKIQLTDEQYAVINDDKNDFIRVDATALHRGSTVFFKSISNTGTKYILTMNECNYDSSTDVANEARQDLIIVDRTSKIGTYTVLQLQNMLVSGENIKTINNQSVLGSGDIEISGGASSWDEIEDKPFEEIGENLEVVEGKLNAIQPTKTSDLTNDGSDGTNPFISGIDSEDVTTALGYTPYNATNPNGYQTAQQVESAITTKDYATNTRVNEVEDEIPDELADLTDDATHRLVTDTEKSTWEAKQEAINDLDDIREGAEAGSTAVQPEAISDMATQTWVEEQGYSTFSGNYEDLTNKPRLPRKVVL